MYEIDSVIPNTLDDHSVSWVAGNGMDENSRRTVLDIVDTPISLELIPANEYGEINQKTEDLVGPYELHDFFLYYFMRFGFRPTKIFMLAARSFDLSPHNVGQLGCYKSYTGLFFCCCCYYNHGSMTSAVIAGLACAISKIWGH